MTDYRGLPPQMASQGGLVYNQEHIDYWREQHAEATARIKELEAERDSKFSPHAIEVMDKENTRLCERVATLEAERDAIEAATIERCAEAVEAVIWRGSSPPEDSAFDAVLEAIRALKPKAVPGSE